MIKISRGFPLLLLIALLAASCSPGLRLPKPESSITGSEFYQKVLKFQWKQRDSLAIDLILNGNVPEFLRRFSKIKTNYIDSASGKKLNIVFYALPDYISIGNNKDWARVPLSLPAAKKIADSLHCFLPTRKMVDIIYSNARVKLEPVPLYIYRDSSITMWQHHLIIEGQRKGKKGLIAGIKKDVVSTAQLKIKPNKIAIYGWHRLNGKPIQPLYTGHVNWYADYSHGIRLVYEKIKVNGRWMTYKDVFTNSAVVKALCDEADCVFW